MKLTVHTFVEMDDPADAILLGRSTYDRIRGFWTEVDDPADAVASALN